jgi:stage III sporulation protein AD
MSVFAIVGITVFAAFLSLRIRRFYPEYSMAVSLLTSILVLGLLISQLAPVLSRLQTLLESTPLSAEYGIIVFKALGIGLLTQLSADACKDAGENSLAEKAELVGKVFMLILALPLFEKIAELAVELMNGGGAG